MWGVNEDFADVTLPDNPKEIFQKCIQSQDLTLRTCLHIHLETDDRTEGHLSVMNMLTYSLPIKCEYLPYHLFCYKLRSYHAALVKHLSLKKTFFFWLVYSWIIGFCGHSSKTVPILIVYIAMQVSFFIFFVIFVKSSIKVILDVLLQLSIHIPAITAFPFYKINVFTFAFFLSNCIGLRVLLYSFFKL